MSVCPEDLWDSAKSICVVFSNFVCLIEVELVTSDVETDLVIEVIEASLEAPEFKFFTNVNCYISVREFLGVIGSND